MDKVLTIDHAQTRLKLVMGFFDNDTTKFMVHLSHYLHNNKKKIHSKNATAAVNDDQLKQEKEKEKKIETQLPEKIITDMNQSTTDKLSDVQSKEKDETVISYFEELEKNEKVDLVSLLKHQVVSQQNLEVAQKIRRVSILEKISKNITSPSGKKMSVIEKNASIIDSAIELAEMEELENAQIEDDPSWENFKGGDEVLITEGINCGLFGILQHGDWLWDYLYTRSTVRIDDGGDFGVDVHTEAGVDEGYWVHPSALQHKTYVIGSEVTITSGVNKGRTGYIQGNGKRLLIENGKFGINILMDDGTLVGYWVSPNCLRLSSEIEKEKGEIKEDKEEIDEFDDFEFLPYVPFPDDDLDEALADALNSSKIDINIKRIVTSSGKAVYRYDGKRHFLRLIHGILLVKDGEDWNELIPILRKLVGMTETETQIFHTELTSSDVFSLATKSSHPLPPLFYLFQEVARGLKLWP